MKDFPRLAVDLITAVGGAANIVSVSNCMTRLRFTLKDEGIPADAAVKKLNGVLGVVRSGGQYQVIIGTEAADLYGEVEKHLPKDSAAGHIAPSKEEAREDRNLLADAKGAKAVLKKAGRFFNALLNAVAGCMVPVIPILLCAGFSKAICAVIGPQLLNVTAETSAVYILFNLVGDAGFSFLPVFVGYTAAKKFNCSPIIGLLLGAVMIHPTIIAMASEGAVFNVYGIPAALQNYSSTVIPIILTIWVMSHVEKFFKRFTPEVLKVFGVPFGTLLVMLPVAFCVTGPVGGFIGKYIGEGLISLHAVAGPLALAILGAFFILLVVTGMHPVLFAFLFVSFPQVGFDPFVLPAMILASWAGAGVTCACLIKLRKKEHRALAIGYFVTWFFGGVGEPMIYGLLIPYKKPLYASMIAGFFAGLVGGFLGLKAYVLNTSNGIYGLLSFFGGDAKNLVVLLISVAISVAVGFIVMMIFKIDEDAPDRETGAA